MLFDPEPAEGDHKWYGTIRASEMFPEFRGWCEVTFAECHAQLDEDFPDRFRREMPQRISELFFAHAFSLAGWKPAPRVNGFDFAYDIPEGGRLLVEVTAPSAPPDDTYKSWGENGVKGFSYDDASVDAALLRLTSGFSSKAKIVGDRIASGDVRNDDYVVIAISGLNVTQETPVRLEVGGLPPDFARAFLPIGPLVVTEHFGENEGERFKYGHEFSGEILRDGKAPVERTALLDGKFNHVHAIAFSPLDALGVEKSREQIGVLHNPSAAWPHAPLNLGMSAEYTVVIESDGFRLAAR